MVKALLALLVAAAFGAAAAFAPASPAAFGLAAATTPRGAGATIVAGRGDKRTKRGKIYHGTHGKCRPAFKNRTTPPDPCVTRAPP